MSGPLKRNPEEKFRGEILRNFRFEDCTPPAQHDAVLHASNLNSISILCKYITVVIAYLLERERSLSVIQ